MVTCGAGKKNDLERRSGKKIGTRTSGMKISQ